MPLSEEFAAYMAEHDADNPATAAATVLALRDSQHGPEILMVQRNAKGTFANNWVFPGGKVDPEDFEEGDDIVSASRRAASREALEEADLVVSEATLIPIRTGCLRSLYLDGSRPGSLQLGPQLEPTATSRSMVARSWTTCGLHQRTRSNVTSAAMSSWCRRHG